jgi:glycosyltransferase involved in cell wall biosynthesis
LTDGEIAPISIVIPAYNAESFIADAIRSVHAQTLRPTEIIVIADDCTDRTPQIAAELGAIVLEQKRRNMAAGLNLGISASTQPWIAFLDADDLWEQDKIALQWKAAQACPAAIVSCDLCTLYEGKVMAPSPRALRERWNNLESVAIGDDCHFFEKVDGDFLVRFYFQTSTVLLRRDVFSSVGIFDESLLFGQTLELFARVMARFPLAFVERPLVYVRVHSGNHSRNVEGGWLSYLAIVERMLKNPDRYPKGAGRAHRERLKRDFLQTERVLAGRRTSIATVREQSHPSKPNQP